MAEISKTWQVVTDAAELQEIDQATTEVLEGKRPAGPPASGSAGVPWGGAGADAYWRNDIK